MKKIIGLIFAIILLIIGLIGLVAPIIPGVLFIIASIALFSRHLPYVERHPWLKKYRQMRKDHKL